MLLLLLLGYKTTVINQYSVNQEDQTRLISNLDGD